MLIGYDVFSPNGSGGVGIFGAFDADAYRCKNRYSQRSDCDRFMYVHFFVHVFLDSIAGL